MRQLKNLVLTMAACFAFTHMYAQYTGPGSTVKLYTVKEVIDSSSKLDKSDVQVKLKGFVIEQINNDTFWFKDATGRIRIEIEKKQMPHIPFNEKSKVVIVGEVDYDLLEGSEVEVDAITIQN